MPGVRLFTAVEPPESGAKVILATRNLLRGILGDGPIRWVREPNFHLTLQFLGDTPESMVSLVQEILGAATMAFATTGVRQLRLATTIVGGFPNLNRPRVIWLGVADPHGDLAGLDALIRNGLREGDVPFDDKPLRPHVTLGYVRKPTNPGTRPSIRDAAAGASISEVAFIADEVVLIQSTLGQGGSVYSHRGRFPFQTR
ncbi:MAG: RNA 2',3'-cyclic phosphodiesterase [Spirochaetales bacterium]|nr:MAG: RNA 2',3'-cyclic phosphodiesterase [Spirochaetales bacterium]